MVSCLTLVAVAAVAVVALTWTEAKANRGNGDLGTVYVISQGLYYDTFVPVETLPPHGRFQQLFVVEGAPNETMYGPGDPGYLGGRWWIDVNGNDEMDAEDSYLLCPLLPKGRENP
jgi:hypothetical protein